MKFLTLLLLIVALLCKSATSSPVGASSCPANTAAVGGSHLTNAKKGTLAAGGFTVRVGGVTLPAGGTAVFKTSSTITVTGNKQFKGFLIRLGEIGNVSTDTALSTSSGGISSACRTAGVGGVTHTSSSLKRSVTATVRMTKAAVKMPLDITIVVINAGGKSEYYYSKYFLTSTV